MKIKFWFENEVQESTINPLDWELKSEGTETCHKFDEDWVTELWAVEARSMSIKDQPTMRFGEDYAKDENFVADENLRRAMEKKMKVSILVIADQDLSGIPEDNWFPSQNEVNLSSDSIGIGGGGSHWTR